MANGTRSFAADDELRAYHLFLQSSVVEHLYVDEECAFAYRKNVSIVDAVKPHAHSKYFYKTDLQRFFTSIDDELVSSTIQTSIARLPFIVTRKTIDHIVQLLTFAGRLPAGFSTSPSLSNACLYKFDRHFGSFCKARKIIYTRYSDDIIISADNMRVVRIGAFMINEALRALYGPRFLSNSYKSRFLHKGKKVKLLGLLILPNGRLTVDGRLKDLVETLLYFYITNSLRFIEMVGGDAEKGMKRIAGYLNHFRSVDPLYVEKLRRKYSPTIVDKFLNLPKMNFN